MKVSFYRRGANGFSVVLGRLQILFYTSYPSYYWRQWKWNKDDRWLGPVSIIW